ncbi:MAG: DUF6734 family protein [Limisphaerales bacterium]
MNYFHGFWTRSLVSTRPQSQPSEIELWDFEALTWMASALEIRRHSPIQLITDTRGLEFVRRTGLDWIYDGRISTQLDDVPQAINPGRFWAAGKVYSYLVVDSPCASVDTDAILWEPLAPSGTVMALNQEYNEWACYHGNREQYARFGFESAAWNWQLPPFNTGVLYFRDARVARGYAETALEFMARYSQSDQCAASASSENGYPPGDVMLFAEQKLLAMCAGQFGQTVVPIGTLHHGGMHLAKNPCCTHLWASKVYYKYCAEARTAYVNFLIAHLLEKHPESAATLRRWKLDRPQTVDLAAQHDYRTLPDEDPRKALFSLLGNIQGVVWIEDSNVDARRRAKKGSLLLPGEVLRPEPGAHYELIVVGKETLKLKQS